MVKAESVSIISIEKAILGEQHNLMVKDVAELRSAAANMQVKADVIAELGDTMDDAWFSRYVALQKERQSALAVGEANLKAATPENSQFSVASQYAADAIVQQLMVAEKNDGVDVVRMRTVLGELNGTTISIEWADGADLPELRFVKPEPKKGRGSTGERQKGDRSMEQYRIEGRDNTPLRVVIHDAPELAWELATEKLGIERQMVGGQLESDLSIPPVSVKDGERVAEYAKDYQDVIVPFMQAFAVASAVATRDDMASTADGGYYQRQRVIPGADVTDKNRHTGRYTTDEEGNIHSPDNEPTDWFRCYRVPNPDIGGEMRDYEVSAWLITHGASAITFYNGQGQCVSHTEGVANIVMRDIGGNGRVGLVRPFVRGYSIAGYTNAAEKDGVKATITKPLRYDSPDWLFHPEV